MNNAPQPARSWKRFIFPGIVLAVLTFCVWTGYFGLFHIDRTVYTEADAADDETISTVMADFNLSAIRYTHDHRLRINRYKFESSVDYGEDTFRALAARAVHPSPPWIEPRSEHTEYDEWIFENPKYSDFLTIRLDPDDEYLMHFFNADMDNDVTVGRTIFFIPNAEKPGTGTLIGHVSVSAIDR